MLTKGERERRKDNLGVWDIKVKTITHKRKQKELDETWGNTLFIQPNLLRSRVCPIIEQFPPVGEPTHLECLAPGCMQDRAGNSIPKELCSLCLPRGFLDPTQRSLGE